MKKVLRYAPSPTGPQHIGGIRTALYCYLYAKKLDAELILRIEDTDQTRFVKGAEEYIVESVKWCGFDFTQGVHIGGPNGPYRQSERSAIYQEHAKQLVESGWAYYAFDTPEEIDEMRAALEAKGQVMPQYNFATRDLMKNSLTLSAEEVQRRIDAGEPYVVRFKVPKKEEVRFHDEIREYVVIHSSHVDDKVLVKSDGLPTYHLANVVDDHLMGVTHVIRGEEWLPSTPLHVLLYRAFGWEDTMPKFAHLPLILKPDVSAILKNKELKKEILAKLPDMFFEEFPQYDGEFRNKMGNLLPNIFRDKDAFSNQLKEGKKDTEEIKAMKGWLHDFFHGKLSKRDGDLLGFPVFPLEWHDPKTRDVFNGYKEMGYLPEAFINYIALLGWHPSREEEIMSIDDMIQEFSLDRVSKGGARFDVDKLNHFNEVYIRAKSPEDLLPMALIEAEKAGISVTEDYLLTVLPLMQERITFVREIFDKAPYFFHSPDSYDEKMASKRWKADSPELLNALKEKWDGLGEWTAEAMETAFNAFLEEKEIGTGALMAPLRLALTGLSFGPGAFDIAAVIGKDETFARIDAAVEKLPVPAG